MNIKKNEILITWEKISRLSFTEIKYYSKRAYYLILSVFVLKPPEPIETIRKIFDQTHPFPYLETFDYLQNK